VLPQVSTIWPGGCKKGELTLEGQQQARDLGDWLRQRYVHHLSFLPHAYSVSYSFCQRFVGVCELGRGGGASEVDL